MTFNNVWTIINLSTVSDGTILGWIGAAGIPSCLRFVFQSPFANAWTLNTSYGGSVPMPVSPWTIIVSSAEDPRFKWTVAGMAIPVFHQATIGHWAGEAANEMGARMWHEILHCYDTPTDSMQTSERAAFTEYLRTTGSQHYSGFASDPLGYENGDNHTQLLIAFYTYLMHKYMDCDCFRLGCWQQPPALPDVPPDDVYPSYEPPYTTIEQETGMNNLLLFSGIVAGLFLIL